MKPLLTGLHFRPEEGTLLDTASLDAIPGVEHGLLYLQLSAQGLTRHGLVLEGLRVTAGAGRIQLSPGLAVVPETSGRLALAPLLEPLSLPAPTSPLLLVASLRAERLRHPGTGLKGAGKRLTLEPFLVHWEGFDPRQQVPIAYFDPERGRLEHDLCRLLQPSEPEVLELVRGLRALLMARLQQEVARGQLEYQGQVQEHLSARDQLYMAGIQSVLIQLRARPTSSFERVRLMSELALQVRQLYRGHPRLRELIRESVASGYVAHEHARQLRLENAAARLFEQLYGSAETAEEGGQSRP
jgi:hypothetical protein